MAGQQSPSAAPWRDLLTKHIGGMKSPIFTLATTHASSSEPLPRARTCVYRGLWAELPDNDKNTADKNPSAYQSDLPVFTSDARMDKMKELFSAHSPPTSTSFGHEVLSGGGQPVEAVWWIEDTGTQWRVRGKAWVLGHDIETDSPGAAAAREAVLARMRPSAGGADKDGWSWLREITGHFGNLSPLMRGSFRNPHPGWPVANAPEDGEGLGQRVDDLEDKLARKQFRVVVIVPDVVDQVDLSDPEKPRRWLYTYRGGKKEGVEESRGAELLGDWEKLEVWP